MHRYFVLICFLFCLTDAVAFVRELGGALTARGSSSKSSNGNKRTDEASCSFVREDVLVRCTTLTLRTKAADNKHAKGGEEHNDDDDVIKNGHDKKDAYNRVKGMWEYQGSLDYIFDNNKKWVDQTLNDDPDTFARLSSAQNPQYLYIGCSDSRVPAQNMLGLTTGELFVHRNVANLCLPTDYSLLSVLAYAVEVLKVTDIIVCGHYDCGGVRAAMESRDHGLLDHWLHNIRDVQRLHMTELKKIDDKKERYRRLIELNVQEQCIHLFANPIVQKMQATQGMPRIHGWVYDVSTGLLKDMGFNFKDEVRKYKDIYRLYDFPLSLREGGREGGVNALNMTSKKKSAVKELAQ